MHVGSRVYLGILICLLAGCGQQLVTVRTTDRTGVPSGQPILCLEARHLPFTLAGDPNKPEQVWGVSQDGTTFTITWPTGFAARFTPNLELLDPSGAVVARGGEVITNAGGAGDAKAWAICDINGKVYTQ